MISQDQMKSIGTAMKLLIAWSMQDTTTYDKLVVYKSEREASKTFMLPSKSRKALVNSGRLVWSRFLSMHLVQFDTTSQNLISSGTPIVDGID